MASVRIFLESPQYVDLEIDPKDVNDDGSVNMEPYYAAALSFVWVGGVEGDL